MEEKQVEEGSVVIDGVRYPLSEMNERQLYLVCSATGDSGGEEASNRYSGSHQCHRVRLYIPPQGDVSRCSD